MSQVSHVAIPLTHQARSHRRALWLGALLALAAIAAVALVVALGESSNTDSVRSADFQAQPSARTDGGPEETAVAASVGSRPAASPDEARIASSIGSTAPDASNGPDESRTATAISGR